MRIVNLIENTPGVEGCAAAHGLSFYIETARKKILFDAGPSEETLKNAERLGIDLRKVDMAILSHGHYDHSGGLLAFAALNPTAPIYMQRGAGGENYAYDGPEKGYRYIGIDKAILALPQVRLLDGDADLGGGIRLFTVEERKHSLPSTNRRIMKKDGDGFIQDDFAHEQSLYIR
nr:MBL fold metallo-hydrolase [Kiritimatiellia bacterium]